MKKHYKKINGCSQSTFQAHLAEIMRRNHISTQGGEYANIYEAFFQQLTEIYDLAGKHILITLITSSPISIPTRVIPSPMMRTLTFSVDYPINTYSQILMRMKMMYLSH